jgi:hypothetical protein
MQWAGKAATGALVASIESAAAASSLEGTNHERKAVQMEAACDERSLSQTARYTAQHYPMAPAQRQSGRGPKAR